jgi:drug/metabolite transporter (DMT)-like permease
MRKGVGFSILAPFLYTLKSVAVKSAPAASLEFFVFFRFLFDLILIIPFYIKYRSPSSYSLILFHFFRGVLGVTVIYCSVYAVRNLMLIDAILLENTLPLFIPLIIYVFQRKKISKKAVLILLIGFSSVFFLLKPKFDMFHLASLAGIGAALATGASVVAVNVISKKESTVAILFYFNLFGCCLSFFPFCFSHETMPSLSYFSPFLLLISFLGVAGQYAVTKAYTLISPHIVGSFFYLSVLFSALFDLIMWEEKMDNFQIFGGLVLVVSSILIIQENRKNTPLSI